MLRPPILIACVHCGRSFWAHHARRLYCAPTFPRPTRNGRARPAYPAPAPGLVSAPVPGPLPAARSAAPMRQELLALALLAAAAGVEAVRHLALPTPREVFAQQLCRALAQIYPPRPA